MRVLFVTTTYPLQPGDSIPSFVADLASALVRDHGVTVRVVAPLLFVWLRLFDGLMGIVAPLVN